MQTLLTDLRYALRTLRRSPGFVAAAVLCLGLGIGANTTIFSLVDSTVFRPLPYADPERLVAVNEARIRKERERNPLSYPEFADWRAAARSFEGFAAHDHRFFNLSTAEEPQHVQGAAVSSDFLRVLGTRPALGRDFSPDDDRPGAARVVLLGHRLWERSFDSDPRIVGRAIRVDGEPATVVGVTPPGFEFPEFAQIWMPLALDAARESRASHSVEALGRLGPGVTAAAAEADLEAAARRLEALYPETNTGVGALVMPLRDQLAPEAARTAMLLMLAAVGFVVLIACANVANLTLARSTARSRELAVRIALGAGRGRLVRQLLAESLVVALAGGVLGVLLAVWGIDLVRAAIPVELPAWIRLELNGRVLVYTLAASLATALLSGLAPALEASRPRLDEALKEGGRGATESPRRNRLRGALVVSEVALSLVLVLSAVLLVRSLLTMHRIEPGFDVRHALTMHMGLTGPAYDDPGQRIEFFREVLERIEAHPAVESAGIVDNLPPIDSWVSNSFEVEGRPVPRGEEPEALVHPVTAGYLSALGIPLVRGRGFTQREASDSTAAVAIVNQKLARRFWPGEDAIGRRLRFDPAEPWLTVVGVAGDVYQGLRIWDVGKPGAEIYIPYARWPRGSVALVVRTRSDPAPLAPAVTSQIRAVDPTLPLFDMLPMETVFTRSFWMPRFASLMFGAFAAIAVALAALGVYGVVAYSVSRRTHEIGVRMALGARSADVVGLVVRQGMRLAALGTALGVLGALAVTRLLEGMLYEVSATDPLSFLTPPLALAGVAFLASWLPARRASRVDPMTTLRYE